MKTRLPLLATGVLSLLCAMWLGLVRLGWNLPLPWPDQLIDHGPLMVCGFLGTLITLERAVDIEHGGVPWAYAAPVLTASGALLVDLGPLSPFGPPLITLGSVMLIAIFVLTLWQEPSLAHATMTVGAVAWFAGNAQWVTGASSYRIVFLWLTFLVLIVSSERLELSRAHVGRTAMRLFPLTTGTLLAGAVVHAWWPELGVRILGAGLVGVAGWLLINDVTRAALRKSGVEHFMAITMYGGCVWLGFGGVVAIVTGAAMPGTFYDALLHAVFLGFVVSMVFAHAPLIFPEIFDVPLPYHARFYAHVILLHASLVLRVLGDLVEVYGRLRSWGGMLNAVAVLLFLANTASSIVPSVLSRRPRSTYQTP